MKRMHRLTSSRDFQRVVRHGSRARSDGVLCFALTDAAAERPPRVGVTATRKIGGAVERNRAKRLLREAARAVMPTICPGSDVVLMAGGEWSGNTFQDIEGHVRVALRKAGAAC